MSDEIIVIPPNPINVSVNPTVGAIGQTGPTGATGATGATGPSGIISVVSPITNTGSSTAAVLGLDQGALSIFATQVVGTVSAATTAANLTGTITAGQVSGTAAVLNAANVFTAAQYVPSLTASTITATQITVIATAVNPTDAVNKTYADNIAAGLNAHDAVLAATTVDLNATYTNGTLDASGGLGIGAILTSNVNGSLIVDGVTTASTPAIAIGERVLVKDQTDLKQNGFYVVSVVGSSTAPWVLTRSSDGDNSIAGELFPGDIVFVTHGATQANLGYVMNARGTGTPTNTIKIGTDNVSFTQFSGAAQITVSAPLTKSANNIALTTPLDPSYGGTGLTTISDFARLGSANTFTAAQTITPTGAQALTVIGDITQSASSPTLTLFASVNNRSISFQPGSGALDSTNTSFHFNRYAGQTVSIGFNSDSRLTVGQGGAFPPPSLAYFSSTLTSAPVVRTRGASSGGQNLEEWQTFDGTTATSAAYVNARGQFTIGTSAAVLNASSITPALGIVTNTAGTPGIIVKSSVSTQTANLQEWQNSGGTVLSSINSAGNLFVQSTQSNYATTTNIGVKASSASVIPLSVQAATSQTANLQEWQNNSGTAISYVLSSGAFVISTLNTNTIQNTASSSNARVQLPSSGSLIDTAVAGNVALRVQNTNATPTGDLQQWLNTGGTVLSRINSVGAALVPYVRDAAGNGNYITFGASSTTLKCSAATRSFFLSAFGSGGVDTQTASVFIYQNNDSTVTYGGRNAVAQIWTGSTAPVTVDTGGATTAASGTGTTATITTTSAHGLAVGDLVTVAGVTPTGYNATAVITAVPTTTSFSYANTTTGSQTVAGTVSVPAQASITARSAGTVGLVVKAAASPTVDLMQWQNSSGTVLATIQNNGQIFTDRLGTQTGGQTCIRLDVDRNVGLATSAGSYGSGKAVVFIANANTVPSTNPTGGGVLYVTSGGLSYIGTSGTNVSIVNGDGTAGNLPVATNALANTASNLGYVLVKADAGKNIETVATSVTSTVFIPLNSSVDFPVGTQITFIQTGTASTRIAGTAGVTVNFFSPTSTTTAILKGQWAAATAVKRSTDGWLLVGNLT